MNKSVRLSELRGIMVISRQEGAHLGFVERAYVDPATGCLSLLTFRYSRFTPERAVPAKAFVAVGRDVLFIDSETMAVPASDHHQDIERWVHDPAGMWVTTRNGNRLGALTDVGVDVDDWHVVELYLAGGKVLAVKASDMTMGRDEVLVPIDSVDHVQEHGGSDTLPLVERLLRVDRVARALQMLSHTPTARAVKRVTSGWPVAASPDAKAAPRARRGDGADKKDRQPTA